MTRKTKFYEKLKFMAIENHKIVLQAFDRFFFFFWHMTSLFLTWTVSQIEGSYFNCAVMLETNGSVQQLQFLNYLHKYLWIVLCSLVLIFRINNLYQTSFSCKYCWQLNLVFHSWEEWCCVWVQNFNTNNEVCAAVGALVPWVRAASFWFSSI